MAKAKKLTKAEIEEKRQKQREAGRRYRAKKKAMSKKAAADKLAASLTKKPAKAAPPKKKPTRRRKVTKTDPRDVAPASRTYTKAKRPAKSVPLQTISMWVLYEAGEKDGEGWYMLTEPHRDRHFRTPQVAEAVKYHDKKLAADAKKSSKSLRGYTIREIVVDYILK